MKDELKYYEDEVVSELKQWQIKVNKKPSGINRLTKNLQNKFNGIIPERIQEIITGAIKNMIKAVLFGSKYITGKALLNAPLMEREDLIKKRFTYYKSTAVATGAGTGAGGFFLGLADFPILLSIKMKYLFDVASLYGFDVKDYKERLFILYVFQLAFSSAQKRKEVFKIINNWENYAAELPDDIDAFNWRSFQQEYRDYIDLVKMFQLIPGIGAVVGAVANFKLMNKLHLTATNAYRMRVLGE